jgi:hypothetical protein
VLLNTAELGTFDRTLGNIEPHSTVGRRIVVMDRLGQRRPEKDFIRDGAWLSVDYPTKPEDWAPERAAATLERLFMCTMQMVEHRLAWYNKRGTNTGVRSRLLRISAIVFGTVGTLLPLIDTALPVKGQIAPFGYVLLAIAAALVAADNAFGVSSSWMRFRLTQMDIEQNLAKFRLDWHMELAHLDGHPPTIEQRKRLLHLLQDFVLLVENAAKSETDGWMQEFRGSLAQLAQSYKSPTEPRTPAAVGLQANAISAPTTNIKVENRLPREQHDQAGEHGRMTVNGQAVPVAGAT